MAQYTIQKGDTLSKISKETGISVSELAKANNISDPNKIYTGATLNIPGQASGMSAGAGGGGGYSGNSGSAYADAGYAASGNGMGNTGYTNSTMTNKYGQTYPGYQKAGTSYDPATGMLQHASGYTGQAVYKDGHFYTPYGALIREDDFLYPAGAKISANGMYVDVGNGWEYAKYATMFDTRTGASQLVPSDIYGVAPNARIYAGDMWSEGLASGGDAQSGSEGEGGGGSDSGGSEEDGYEPTDKEVDAVMRLIEYVYNHKLNEEWEEYTKGNRGY